MKAPTRGPFYACLYHGLCDTARKHGYALAIHGSIVTDLDLVAIPWTNEAVDPETLVAALREHIGMLTTVPGSLLNDTATEKPHGRRAWNLYMDFGAKVDLSVMPRQ